MVIEKFDLIARRADIRGACIAIAAALAVLIISSVKAASPAAQARATAHAHDERSAARSVLSLDVYATGDTVDVLTGETDGLHTAPAIWYRRSSDGGKSWSPPVRVDQGLPAPHQPHRSNDPQVASNGRQVIAVWASAGRGFRGSGAMVTALSDDGGRTWRRGGNPADDNRHDGHGFSDLTARGTRFHLAWLDSRNGAQGVRYAKSDDGGANWSANASVKSSSCECCWNTLLPGPGRAVYLLYRSKAPRDMGFAVSPDDGATWKTLGPVGAFNWQIDACPHTGGALALAGRGTREQLHAIVWTGKPEVRGLHYLTSRDGGANWSPSKRLGGEYAQRADLASLGDHLIAVWDEPVGQHGAVFFARSNDGGSEWSKPVRLSADTNSASYPRVVAARSNLLVMWTEAIAGESKLRMVLMK